MNYTLALITMLSATAFQSSMVNAGARESEAAINLCIQQHDNPITHFKGTRVEKTYWCDGAIAKAARFLNSSEANYYSKKKLGEAAVFGCSKTKDYCAAVVVERS